LIKKPTCVKKQFLDIVDSSRLNKVGTRLCGKTSPAELTPLKGTEFKEFELPTTGSN